MNFQYLKPLQVAKLFNVSREVVIKWISDGTLPAITTPGGHYRMSNEDIEKLRETIKFNPINNE